MIIRTGAGAILSAAHRGQDGAIHGHTWEVWAEWNNQPCAVEAQARLQKWLGKFDHTELPFVMSRGEAIAQQCLMALGCSRVEVRRSGERIYAIAEQAA